MAAQNGWELADNQLARLPPETIVYVFWVLLILVIIVAWPRIRKALLSVLEDSVHKGINGTAEKVAEMEKDLQEMKQTLAFVEGMVSKGLVRSYRSREGDTGTVSHRRDQRDSPE